MKREAEATLTRLNDLIEEIEQSRIGDDWSISLDAAMLCLESSPESFYRYYYRSGRSIADLPERFHSENVSILLEYLMELGYSNAITEFRRRGWYLSQEDYLLWEEFFVSMSLSLLASHTIDEEELEVALSGCRFPSDGLHFYCETKCSIDWLITRALNVYLKKHLLNEGAIRLLRRHTEELFQRRLLRRETIYLELKNRLYELSMKKGWIAARTVAVPESLREALELFGFHELPREEELKKRYRLLLKSYHPDVNRTSEAATMTRSLIDACAEIQSYLKK
jgi:hypothetical protein